MGWTAETVYEHFTQLGEARDRATQAALAAQNTRLDGMNEFRASLKDAQSSFATRVDLDTLKETSQTFITRGEVYALCASAITIGGIIGALFGHQLR